jgi:uncharacterized protein YndB with AHSA1/START domain
MERIQFDITINAPVEKVYSTMLAINTYQQWTAIFNPTSTYEGKWETGEKILFTGISKEGKKAGMVSRIKEAVPNKLICIEHLGLLNEDVEITTGPEVEGWAGALEIYHFNTAADGGTSLQIEMDANEDFKSYFEDTWPKALDKLKEICESN